MKYYVICDGSDDCTLPTTPTPMALGATAGHIIAFLDRFRTQGYYFNCRQERIPLDQLTFRIVPETHIR